MIISRGLGILVLPVGFAPFLLSELLIEWIAQDEDYYQRELWPALAASWLSAGTLFGLQVWIERRAAKAQSTQHSFFFAPVAWWPWIVAGFGIVVTALRVLGFDA